MDFFQLPITTYIQRFIPKNSFDKFTNSKEKKDFVEFIDKIRWMNKLSIETINLSGKDIKEIQVFEITLKTQADIEHLTKVIDKSIPYPIIFVIKYNESFQFIVSKKHHNPINENLSVVDWTFKSGWIQKSNIPYFLNLRQSIDFIFEDFCMQLSGYVGKKISLKELIDREQKIKELQAAISKLETSISKSAQFNRKVELNLKLQKFKSELLSLT